MSPADEQSLLGQNSRNVLDTWIFGDPVPGGSKKGFIVPPKPQQQLAQLRMGRRLFVNIVDANDDVDAWKKFVARHVRREFLNHPIVGKPMEMITFYSIQRPKSHYNKSGSLKKGMHFYPIVRPDALKLTRPVEDALEKIVYDNDAQIINGAYRKRYVDEGPGVRIVVNEILVDE